MSATPLVRWRLALITAMVVAVVWPAAALAADGQDDQASKLKVQDVTVGEGGRVKVKVAVPGRRSDRVPAEAFTVIEDGERRDVEVRRIPTDLDVVLAVDTSGSVARKQLRAVKTAALSFVASMPRNVRLAVVEFDNHATLLTKLTQRRGPVRRAIRNLQSGGRSSLYDGIRKAVAAFDRNDDARRHVVLMADGEDNESAASLAEARTVLRRHDATLHAIGVATAFSEVKPLRKLADAGDGKVTSLDDTARVQDAYRATAAEVGNEYELTYRSDTGGRARVEVIVDYGGGVLRGARTADLPPAPVTGGILSDIFDADFWTQQSVLTMAALLWLLLLALFVTSLR